MKANIVDISPTIPYLAKFLFSIYGLLTTNLQKSMGDEVDFLPADKHENFLQIDSITLGVHSLACPQYPGQVYNIFAIKKSLKENVKDEVDFLPADIRQMFSQNDTIILGVWPGMPKLSK